MLLWVPHWPCWAALDLSLRWSWGLTRWPQPAERERENRKRKWPHQTASHTSNMAGLVLPTLASRVFPQPGGPASKTPDGALRPRALNCSGERTGACRTQQNQRVRTNGSEQPADWVQQPLRIMGGLCIVIRFSYVFRCWADQFPLCLSLSSC